MKMAPALRTRAASASAPSHCRLTCSAATSLITSRPASRSATRTAAPWRPIVSRARSPVARPAARRGSAASTASSRSGSSLTTTAIESGPCSDCARRSRATCSASAVRSASTMHSDGPAGRSIATRPLTARFAAVTHALPAPKILSTAGTESVPNARAAIAWAPPALRTRSTPPMRAATSTSGEIDPSSRGGVAMIRSSTPARRAGTASIRTLLGYVARPPGT